MGGPAAADPGLRKEGGHYYTKGSRHLGVYTSVEREREEERAPSTCERRGGTVHIRTTALEGILLTY